MEAVSGGDAFNSCWAEAGGGGEGLLGGFLWDGKGDSSSGSDTMRQQQEVGTQVRQDERHQVPRNLSETRLR